MREECEPLVNVIHKIQAIIPRCERTGKVVFEPASAEIIAENMSRRLNETWAAIHCDGCGKVHLWKDGKVE